MKMKKLVYSINGGVAIVAPAAKEDIEKELGPMTVEEYEAHVRDRSRPIQVDEQGNESRVEVVFRELNDEDMPQNQDGTIDRTFRNAWEDTQPGNQIDISCEKARDMVLTKNEAMAVAHDKQMDDKIRKAEIEGDVAEVARLNTMKSGKRSDYNSKRGKLNNMDVRGKYNDAALLSSIKAEMIEE